MEKTKENFVLTCLNENLIHARHVENERMMFNSLFSALAGGALAFISQVGSKPVITVMIGILMMMNIICYIFTKRWNKVFKTHYALAQKIYLMFLREDTADAGEPPTQEEQDKNPLYFFSNQQTKKPHSLYISTGQYFIIYNVLMFVLLLCSLGYFLTVGAI